MMPKKILVTNAYTWKNKGDAAIVLGTINSIKQCFGNDTKITISSMDPGLDNKSYKIPQINFIESPLFSVIERRSNFVSKFMGAIGYSIYLIFVVIIFRIFKINLSSNKFIKNL